MTAEGGVGPRALYFEDFHPGDRHAGGAHHLTESEILEFGHRFDPQIFHTDPDAACDSIFGGLVASGLHTLAISARLFADLGIYHGTLLGGVEIEGLRFLHPVRPRDTLRIEAEVNLGPPLPHQARQRHPPYHDGGLQPARREGDDLDLNRLHQAPEPWWLAHRLERFQFDWNRSRPQGGPPVARRARAGADHSVRCRERNRALEWVRFEADPL